MSYYKIVNSEPLMDITRDLCIINTRVRKSYNVNKVELGVQILKHMFNFKKTSTEKAQMINNLLLELSSITLTLYYITNNNSDFQSIDKDMYELRDYYTPSLKSKEWNEIELSTYNITSYNDINKRLDFLKETFIKERLGVIQLSCKIYEQWIKLNKLKGRVNSKLNHSLKSYIQVLIFSSILLDICLYFVERDDKLIEGTKIINILHSIYEGRERIIIEKIQDISHIVLNLKTIKHHNNFFKKLFVRLWLCDTIPEVEVKYDEIMYNINNVNNNVYIISP